MSNELRLQAITGDAFYQSHYPDNIITLSTVPVDITNLTIKLTNNMSSVKIEGNLLLYLDVKLTTVHVGDYINFVLQILRNPDDTDSITYIHQTIFVSQIAFPPPETTGTFTQEYETLVPILYFDDPKLSYCEDTVTYYFKGYYEVTPSTVVSDADIEIFQSAFEISEKA